MCWVVADEQRAVLQHHARRPGGRGTSLFSTRPVRKGSILAMPPSCRRARRRPRRSRTSARGSTGRGARARRSRPGNFFGNCRPVGKRVCSSVPACALVSSAGRANCLQSQPQPNSGSAKLPWWQYGKPKCWPFFAVVERIVGQIPASQSRPLLVYQSSSRSSDRSRSRRCCARPDVLDAAAVEVHARDLYGLPGSQMLYGALIGT